MQGKIDNIKNNISDLLDKIIDINNKNQEKTLAELRQLLNSLQQKMSEDSFNQFVNDASNWLQEQKKAKSESYKLLRSNSNHKIYQTDINKFPDLRTIIEKALGDLNEFANYDKKNKDKIKPKAEIAAIFLDLDSMIKSSKGYSRQGSKNSP